MKKIAENKYIIAISVLALLIIGVMTAAAYLLPNIYTLNQATAVNNELLNLPKVNSVIYSKDGSEHSIELNFTVAINENLKKTLDTDSVHSKITEIVNELDYDKVRQKGGMDYIKTEVALGIAPYIGTEDLKGLYISNINTDNTKFEIPEYIKNPVPSAEPVPNKPTVNDLLKGLGQRNRGKK